MVFFEVVESTIEFSLLLIGQLDGGRSVSDTVPDRFDNANALRDG